VYSVTFSDLVVVARTADPRIGTELAGYRIEGLLGRGGIGVVYLAAEPQLDRRVALKLLPPELAHDSRFRERFLAESRRAAAIEHPCIVPVHQAGEAAGVLYIAMRYVRGTDLRALLARVGRLPPDRALGLLSGVAAALDAAHARGLVHRDVKPSNILISEGSEHAYLTDFGLAKDVAAAGLTESGEFLGTVDYVSPEQIEGREVDGRADVYALGAVLFECLAGDPPFRRDSPVGTIWAHTNEAPPSLSERRPELPGELDAVVAQALAKASTDRYGACTELIAAARAALGLESEEPSTTRRYPRALVDHCRDVLRTLAGGRLVPVLGHGTSGAARQAAAPGDAELASHLAGRFAYPRDSVLELPRVSQYVSVTHGDGPLWDELHDILDADWPVAPVHRLLAAFPALLRAHGAPPELVVTTGYDTALEQAFSEAGEEVDVVAYVATGPHRGRFWHRAPDGTITLVELPNAYAEASPDRRTLMLKLHGGVDRTPGRGQESFVVTEDDYIAYLDAEAGTIPVGVAARLRRSHFLFLGFDVADWNLRVLLRRLWGGDAVRYRSWAVLGESDSVERRFWLARGVEVVEAPLADYVGLLERAASEQWRPEEQ
jgi:Protein kinase domain/SIR2-like domain